MEQFIVIENHGGAAYAIIVTDTDGNNKVFDTRGEAEAEAPKSAKTPAAPCGAKVPSK